MHALTAWTANVVSTICVRIHSKLSEELIVQHTEEVQKVQRITHGSVRTALYIARHLLQGITHRFQI